MRHESGYFATFLSILTILLAGVFGCGPSSEVGMADSSSPQAPEKNRVDVGAAAPMPTGKTASVGSSEVAQTGAEMPLGPQGSGKSSVQPVAMPSEIAMKDDSEEEATEPKFSRRELFEGWDKPQLALFLTGQQHGYIEPCGCTGLDNQKGGLMRRQTFLNQLRNDRGWDVVALDVGNQVRRFGRQPEIKFQTTAEGLKKMGYEAVSFGPDDLRLSVDEVFAAVASEDPDNIKYISSNASLLGFTPKHRIVEAGGKKIGITGVLGAKEQQKISNSEVEMGDPMQELEASWNALKAENCDLYVLLSHASLEESRQYAKAFPGFQIVVTAGGAGEPTLQPEVVEGTNSQMIQVGTKGMYVGVVGLFNDPQNPIRYERVALDARFKDSEEMLRLLASYQKQLETLGLDGLGIRPQPHSSGYSYVGSESCADCHSEAYEVWENSKHSHATDTLVHPPERYEVPRHFDPECLACHVTGWNPELYLPYRSGYLGLETTPNMKSVGCENCHGPGSHHVASQNGEGGFTDEQTALFVDQMKLPLESARDTCLKCHDLDNSPDFHVKGAFEKYWEEIKH
ncbi:Perchlorate reductase subunit gamma precursor [Bremerella volcania]|uniref:Perchlorate reductase subunit gamma n=1 Tax=Bremerella volcania TaxID=2527984 RepID=A0A518C6E7_9BACT|nr:multiheme c-type cytochrome [Bremerella volcania]QDU74790.1 Perchlorate reductase subunit gamma precursor [Bremerella volcania]